MPTSKAMRRKNRRNGRRAFPLLPLLMLGLISTSVSAEEALPTLPTVTVVGTLESPATGRSTIGGTLISDLPSGNGSIAEILELLPDVRIDRASTTSRTAGELLPPTLSISGGPSSQNAFLIDGSGSDSLLDPDANTPSAISQVPGHPQEIFLEADLLESVTLFDSNIPAEYGGFTGGVIDAAIRTPGTSAAGSLFYRTTQDDWTNFHLTDEQKENFETSGSASSQPRFEKHHFGATFDIPLGGGKGLLASGRQLRSTIPLHQLGEAKEQHRTLENWLLKYVQPLPGDAFGEASLVYTPYSGDYFIQSTQGSDFTIRGGGLLLRTGYERLLDWGELNLDATFRQGENSRSAPTHFRKWAATDSKDWGRIIDSDLSLEGGYGDVDTTQRSIALQADVTFLPVSKGEIDHEFRAGVQLEQNRGEYDRPETTYVYGLARLNDAVVCGEDTFACIEGEQFFTERQIYAASSVDARINSAALFAEDRLSWKRLELRPGARLSRDDYMGNTNLAPRLAAEYDLFGNGKTVLTAGANRYYGKSLLAFKLREAILPFTTETRTTYMSHLTAWSPWAASGKNITEFSRLDTPYSDEVTAGVDQALAGGRLSFKFVQREGRDEFVRSYGPVQPDGLRYYTMTNDGESSHKSLRLSWSRRWAAHFLALHGSWRRHSGDTTRYDQVLSEDDADRLVVYQGIFLYQSELPDGDQEPPFEASLVYVASLPWQITFTNVTRYTSRYTTVETNGAVEVPEGEDGQTEYNIYEKVENRDAVLFDWKIAWRQATWKGQTLELALEIDNVFDSRVPSPGSDNYAVGRQFWAEVGYSF